jgi:hypothetical protein
MQILIFTVTGIFFLLGLLHCYWAFGGKRFGMAAVPHTEAGQAVFEPGKFATLIVAAGLFLFAIVIAANGGWFGNTLPAMPVYAGTIVIACIFALRAIGEFRYVGLFKRYRTTAFARKDTRIYTPLCLFLSLSCWLILYL